MTTTFSRQPKEPKSKLDAGTDPGEAEKAVQRTGTEYYTKGRTGRDSRSCSLLTLKLYP